MDPQQTVAEPVLRSLEWQADWPASLRVTVALIAALVFVMSVWNYRTLQNARRRWHLLVLRGAILGLLVAIFFQPTFVSETVARSKNTIAVLVDDSASMALPAARGSRRESAMRWLDAQRHYFDTLSERNELLFFRFGESLMPLDGLAIDKQLEAKGRRTQVLETLEALRERLRHRDVGGVVLISDGIDNGVLSDRLGEASELDETSRRLVASFAAPVHTVSTGNADVINDLAVTRIAASRFAFVRTVATLEATVRVSGYRLSSFEQKETRIEMRLFEDAAPVASQALPLSDERDVKFTFEVSPRSAGVHVYSFAVAPLEGEATLDNNVKHVVVRVVRDRIRVLQLAGHPSWDVRFLRNHLRNNANVDLISFFILVGEGSAAFIGAGGDTTLIPFPTQEIFEEELGGFDLIVFQDFQYGPFGVRRYLPRLRDYVSEGGAFLMVGGRLGFASGGYAGTEIVDVLPVAIDEVGSPEAGLSDDRVRLKLTPEGERHPVAALDFDAAQNRQAWSALPDWEGYNHAAGLQPGAVALARSDRGEAPIIALRDAGKGRSATILGDSLWLWAMSSGTESGDERRYDRFVSNLVRWLIKDPELRLVRVSAADETPVAKKVTALTTLVLKPDYAPSPATAIKLVIKRRKDVPLAASQGTPGVKSDAPAAEIIETPADLVTDERGEATIRFEPPRAGVYEATANVNVAGLDHSDTLVFLVESDDKERLAAVPTQDVLGAIARASNGRAMTVDDTDVEPAFLEPKILRVTAREELELWNLPWVLLAAVALMGAEWWLRRRYGFI